MCTKEVSSILRYMQYTKSSSDWFCLISQKLSRPDILDNIIMITPGLSQDPVAISMIQDPELLVRMGDIDTVRRWVFAIKQIWIMLLKSAIILAFETFL